MIIMIHSTRVASNVSKKNAKQLLHESVLFKKNSGADGELLKGMWWCTRVHIETVAIWQDITKEKLLNTQALRDKKMQYGTR